MSYTPPSYNAVHINFVTTPYTPPSYNLVDFNFVNIIGTVVVNTASYTATLSTLNLLRSNYYTAASRVQYTSTFNPVTLNKGRVLSLTSLILTVDLKLETNKTLVVPAGLFTTTLNNVGLNKGPILEVVTTEYIVNSPANITFSKTYILPFDTSAYTVTATPDRPLLNYGKTQYLDVTTYSVTNSAVAFSRNYNLTFETGNYTVTANDVTLNKNLAGAITTISLTSTLNAVNFSKGYILSISPTSYSVGTVDHTVRSTKKLMVGSIPLTVISNFGIFKDSILEITKPTFTLTNNPVLPYFNRAITPINFSYTLTGNPVGLTRQSKVIVDTTSYVVTTNAISLNKAITFSITNTLYTLTFNNLIVKTDKVLPISTNSLTLSVFLTDLLSKKKINISSTPFTLSSLLSLLYARIFAINTSTYTVVTNPIYLIRGLEFSRDIRVIALSNPSIINYNSNDIKIIPVSSTTLISNSNENKLLINQG